MSDGSSSNAVKHYFFWTYRVYLVLGVDAVAGQLLDGFLRPADETMLALKQISKTEG